MTFEALSDKFLKNEIMGYNQALSKQEVVELFIGDIQDPSSNSFPVSYLEINLSPRDQLFANRVENPYGNRHDHPSAWKHIELGELDTGIQHSTELGNHSYKSKVLIPWRNILS